MKSKGDKIEKYSMKDVDPLIESILKAKNITEEALCKSLEYNEGYISQLRSREKSTGEPQVSTKFYNQLKSLQNASIKGNSRGSSTVNGWLTEVNESTPNDRLMGEIEARRRDFEKWAELARQDKEKAEKEKDRLLNIIENNLTLLIRVVGAVDTNLKTALEDLHAIEFGQRAQHTVMLHSLERIEKVKPGKLQKELSTAERAYLPKEEQTGKTADAGRKSTV